MTYPRYSITVPVNYCTNTIIKPKQYNFSGHIPHTDVYIKSVIYSNPATIVLWNDGTKTVCKCQYPDVYSEETGLAICILKKVFGAIEVSKLFSDWIPTQNSLFAEKITLKDVMKKNK